MTPAQILTRLRDILETSAADWEKLRRIAELTKEIEIDMPAVDAALDAIDKSLGRIEQLVGIK